MIRSILFLLLFFFSCNLQAQNEYKLYLNLSYTELDSLMYVYYEKGVFDKVIPLMQAGQKKAKNEFGEQDTIFAKYTADLGLFYKLTGQYNKALPLYIQSKNIREKKLGKDHPDYATSLNNLALLHESMGNYDQALPLLTECVKLDEQILGAEHPNLATSLNNLALLHESMGNYDQALPLHLQSKKIREKNYGKEHPIYATSLNNLAAFHKNMGNYDKAIPLFIQAIDIREKTLGREHPEFSASLSNLATVYENMGDYDKALPLFIEAKEIDGKVLGKEHPAYAASLHNLSVLHESMGNYDKALPLSIEAKSIYEKALGTAHPHFAFPLNNIARLHQAAGNYDKALPLLLQAKDIMEEAFGKQHPLYVSSLNNLAGLYQLMGDYKKAWTVLAEAMNGSAGINLTHRFDMPWMKNLQQTSYASNELLKQMVLSLGYAYNWLGQDPSAQNVSTKQIVVADLATFLLTKLRRQVSNEKDKLRMLTQSNNWLVRSLAVYNPKKDIEKAFQLSDQNKSVLLLQATQSEAAYRLGELPDSLVSRDKKLLKIQSLLQAKLLEKRSENEKDSLRLELNDVNQELEDFMKLIEKEYSQYYKLRYQQVELRLESIQGLLDEKSALIEYVIADSILHIFRVDQKELIWHQEKITASLLRDKVEQLHQSLSDYSQISKKKEQDFENYVDLAHFFYKKLLAPVLKSGTFENLIIISDGELGHLPFESFLVEPATGKNFKDLHYLLNDYNISYNYSASLWKENKTAKKQKNNGQMLGMAAHYMEELDSNLVRGRLSTALWVREALSPLPAAREEVEALAAQFKGHFAFDSLASERFLLEKVEDYAVVHLAMHGLLDEKRPILSSLAFTEDGDSLHDNFWQAHEISKMKLNADLVVLSACETGYGRFETGNGIASLARAFMYAGAPALVVSLWQVNDASTSIIMQRFYQYLASGMTKSEALRQAKLDYIDFAKEENSIAAHPAFWSPFILIGNTEPVSIKKKGNPWAWGIGLGALALFGIGGLVYRKRDR